LHALLPVFSYTSSSLIKGIRIRSKGVTSFLNLKVFTNKRCRKVISACVKVTAGTCKVHGSNGRRVGMIRSNLVRTIINWQIVCVLYGKKLHYV
jgi:hypothetical protein